MNNTELKELIEEFNSTNFNFGVIDYDFLVSDHIEYERFYYYFPMIERVVREIIHHTDELDIESYENQTYRTLNSIITINKNDIELIFGEEITYFLVEVYGDGGIRNDVMHYRDTLKYKDQVIDYLEASKYIFIELVKLYMKLLINNKQNLEVTN